MDDLKFSTEDCDRVLAQCLQRADIKTVDFEVIPRHRDNYIFKITFEDAASGEETRCFYAKSKSRLPKIDEILEDFRRTLPGFDATLTPKFYCCKSELFFYEDLTCQRLQNECGSFTLKHVQCVLRVLARIHAAGFVAEDKKEIKLNEEYSLETSNFNIKEAEALIWSLLADKETINETFVDLEERQVSSRFRKILCHGNLTRSNILFHYDQGIPDDCKLVNFKCQLYAPPVYDFLQVILFNTDSIFRQKHLESLLFHYYNCLKEEIEKYDSDVNRFLLFEDLKLSSHNILPLVKLETAMKNQNDSEATKPLKEALNEPRLSREDCYIIIKNKTRSTEYDFGSYEISKFSKNSIVEIRFRQCSDDKTLKCFLRCEPTKLETFFYGEFVPKLQDFGIDIMNDCCPFCYYHRSGDVIVLEHLTLLGYKQQQSFDFNSLVTVLEKLAKFHGGTLIFEEKMAERTKKPYRLVYDYGILSCDRDLCDRFRGVLCIGRMTAKSIFAKFCENKCLFADLSNIAYGVPALDFLGVLKMADESTRSKSEELGKVYFNELSATVAAYNYNINRFFSYDEFVESLRHVRSEIDDKP